MIARWVIPRRFGPAVALLSLLAMPAYAATSQSPSRFQLSGSGSLSASTVPQTGAGLRLRATLSPGSAAVTQTALGYSLTGDLAPVPLVCYADTIFRDGFEVY